MTGLTDDHVKLVETIATVLRIAQFSAVVTTRLADGFPHLLIGSGNFSRLAFVRADETHLTDEEWEFRRSWAGPPILLLRNPDQALNEVGYWTHRDLRERQRA